MKVIIKVLIKVLIIMALFSCKSTFGATPEEGFWKWFQKNENIVFNFEKDRENVFNKLASKMNAVNEDLTFEFGQINDDGKREFVISAGGIKSSFPAVESMYSSAPNMEKWIFIKYRQRRKPINDLEYAGILVAANDVHYQMFKDENKVGIVIFLDGYNEEQRDVYANIGYLFLDEALGEYDIETRVGFIEFHNRESKHYEGAMPIAELADAFDEYFLKQ